MTTAEARPARQGERVLAPLRLQWWVTPGVFILGPVAMSFIAWATFAVLGEFGYLNAFREMLTGFAVPATVSYGGIGLLLFWYCAMVATSTVGWRLAADRFMPAQMAARTSSVEFERRYFFVVLATAAAGVAYSYYKIASTKSIIDALANQSGNDFTKSLSGTAGLETLRYAVILAAPLGIYLWRKKVIKWPYMLTSVLLIMANSLIASRLSLLMASVVFLIMSVHSRAGQPQLPRHHNRLVQVISILLIGFAALAMLNFFRNANYYREAGVTNPAAMNLYQMGTYLAVPAQVTLGVADAVAEGRYDVAGDHIDSIDAVQPTFLQFKKVSKDDSWKDAVYYHYSVTFASSFFTNSVFADTYAVFGVWGWFYTFLLYGVAGYAFARIMRYGSVVAGSGGVLAYCFAEVWRIQIVNYGIVIFLLLLTAGAAVLALRWPARARKTDTMPVRGTR
ncbi:O-antigen polymerase [Mycolicibacterium aichiense]|uniref:O-antigen polymerase n=1 Tax=Mycolicibacterium aichiense TaxID=1799 RepID=UPI003D67492F